MMKTGKISETALRRSVLKQCRAADGRMLQGAGVGNDAALIDIRDGRFLACSTSPAVIDDSWKIRFALEHTMNNLVCSGCLPRYMLLTVLLPAEAGECALGALMREAAEVCRKWDVQIAGGHTEVCEAVTRPVLSVTGIGISEDRLIRTKEARPGMALLVGGYIGMEGTALLARRYEKELKERFSDSFIGQAKELGEHVCTVRLASCAAEAGAAALHDASQGGIFGALWEMCEGARVGLEAELRRIPVRQETIEICEYLGKNPYCLLSGGALLIAAKDGKAVQAELQKQGIPAAVIGTLTGQHERILRNGGEIRFLERPAQDEIWKGIQTEWQI